MKNNVRLVEMAMRKKGNNDRQAVKINWTKLGGLIVGFIIRGFFIFKMIWGLIR